MGFMDGFTSDGTVDMKHTEYYNLMENAGKGSGGYVQNVNITSPKALSPYEIARQTRLQTRSMILAVQRG